MIKIVDVSTSDNDNQLCQKINTNFKNILTALNELDTTQGFALADETAATTSYVRSILNNYATKESLNQLEDTLTDIVKVSLDSADSFKLLNDYAEQNIYNDLTNGRALVFEYEKDGAVVNSRVEHTYTDITNIEAEKSFVAYLVIEKDAMVDMYTYTFTKTSYKLVKRTWIVAGETIVTGD